MGSIRARRPEMRIGGGTDEVMKTVLAERMLGLPC